MFLSWFMVIWAAEMHVWQKYRRGPDQPDTCSHSFSALAGHTHSTPSAPLHCGIGVGLGVGLRVGCVGLLANPYFLGFGQDRLSFIQA